MDPKTMRQHVAAARTATLATIRPDGHPHVVPCCFVLDGDRAYSAVDAKPKSTLALRRLDNIRATPAVSLLVDRYDEDWSALWWVRMDGTARVIDGGAERDAALALLVDKYDQYARHPPPGAVVAVEITGWRAWP